MEVDQRLEMSLDDVIKAQKKEHSKLRVSGSAGRGRQQGIAGRSTAHPGSKRQQRAPMKRQAASTQKRGMLKRKQAKPTQRERTQADGSYSTSGHHDVTVTIVNERAFQESQQQAFPAHTRTQSAPLEAAAVPHMPWRAGHARHQGPRHSGEAAGVQQDRMGSWGAPEAAFRRDDQSRGAGITAPYHQHYFGRDDRSQGLDFESDGLTIEAVPRYA
ncbi:hypothetical protein WJX73_005002 [Symbiochloris irregularis]|uniref:Uncharacterized protein n=1 Tax=Symbiochloris irregularis TaxID=706552 RepID=A0AAW1PIY2_9CHLO